MIIGRIIGKVTTREFCFLVEQNPKKFDYVQVLHKDYDYTLCQIVEIEKRDSETVARCKIIGYLDENNKVQQIRTPFEPESEVLAADDKFIQSIIRIDDMKTGAYMGFLEGKRIPIYLNLNTLLTKHLAVLAKSGAGKSYSVGVLLEEIIEKGVPLLIIDPHGEYSLLKYPNENDKETMEHFGIKKRGYIKQITEYGDTNINEGARPLRLPGEFTSQEIINLVPSKLSAAQQNLLYSALKDINRISFEGLIANLELEENNAKFSVISIIEYMDKLGIFSKNPTPYNEIIKSRTCSIVNLKGIDPQAQEMIVSKLLADLFELRKKELIPPFFTVIEESHTFCPERSFGETKASRVIRTIASEGRKFGLGLCVVTQRPARVDKSVLSQCSTQLILKVTNPNDLKAISASVEGITSDAEKEIINLPIGTALITGIVDAPLFVNIRPRRSCHGGEAVNMLASEIEEEKKDFIDKVKRFERRELLPVIKPKITKKDIMLMSEQKIKEIITRLVPSAVFLCKGKEEFNLLADLARGGIVYNGAVQFLPDLDSLHTPALRILKAIFTTKNCSKEKLMSNKLPDLDESLSALIDKGYIMLKDGLYSINQKYVFASLEKRKTYSKISYTSVKFNEKLKTSVSAQEMKKNIQKFIKVKDIRECWKVSYDVIHESAAKQ